MPAACADCGECPVGRIGLADVITPGVDVAAPAGDRGVRSEATGMGVACADRGERPVGRVGLPDYDSLIVRVSS